MSSQKRKAPLSIRVDDKTRAELEEVALEENRSIANTIKTFVKEGLAARRARRQARRSSEQA